MLGFLVVLGFNLYWLQEKGKQEYKNLYKNGEWWGFQQIYEDWKGERYLLKYLLKWYTPLVGKEIPDWIYKED